MTRTRFLLALGGTARFRGRNMRHGKQSYRRRLLVEPLEDRRLLAGVELLSAAHPDLLSDTAGGLASISPGAVSADGRYVAFLSTAPNLVSHLDVFPNVRNVYRFDRQTGDVLLVSVNAAGTASGNGDADDAKISANGSVVAFRSRANNLHALDTDSLPDIFVRDLNSSTTHLVSVNSAGTGSANFNCADLSISTDGSVVAFKSFATNLHDKATSGQGNIFARDLNTGITQLVSVDMYNFRDGNGESFNPVISGNGSIVAYSSVASNLHIRDSDTIRDVFARDLTSNTTHLVSVNPASNASGNGPSDNPAISSDGLVIAFSSSAGNLHDRATAVFSDIFARNLTTNTTDLVSINIDGNAGGNGNAQRPAISADGFVVAFGSAASDLDALDTNTNVDVFARNLTTSTTHLVSVNVDGNASGDGGSSDPVISADGTVIAFASSASNLHELPAGGNTGIFARDLDTSTTHMVSINTDRNGGGNAFSHSPAISANGEAIAFISDASNLVAKDFDVFADAFLRHLPSTSTSLVSRAVAGAWSSTAGGPSKVSTLSVSEDGRYVTFSSRAPNLVSGLHIVPGVQNIYRFDRETGEVVLVSVNKSGMGSGNGPSHSPVISADGSLVAFSSYATNLHTLDDDEVADIFVRDLLAGTTYLVSVNVEGEASGNASSLSPVISADGSVVAFTSSATNLQAQKTDEYTTDVFVRYLGTDTTYLISADVEGTGSGNRNSDSPTINAVGSVIAFRSSATNLQVVEKSDWTTDIFVRDLSDQTTHLVSINKNNSYGGNRDSSDPVISANGFVVAFTSYASDLHDRDTDTSQDVFARNWSSNTTHLVSINTSGNSSGNGPSFSPTISADGSIVAFSSSAWNLHSVDWDSWTDIFARDLNSNTTHLASVNWAGNASGNGHSSAPAISADGSVVAFQSGADNLHAWDTDRRTDIFARNLSSQTTRLVTVNTSGTGSANDSNSDAPVISADGSMVAFSSLASNLVELDYNGNFDAFAFSLEPVAPVADAGGPYTVVEGSPLTLDATGTVDSAQATATLVFAWDLDYDGETFDVDATGIQPNVSFLDDFAPRTIAVRATNRGGLTDIATTTLEVTNGAPTATLSYDPVTYGQLVTVRFSAKFDPSPIDMAAGLRYAFASNPYDLLLVTYENASVDDFWEIPDLAAGEYPVYGRIIDKDDGFTQYSTTVIVDKAPLTVTADNKAKVYGADDPALTYTASGELFYDDDYDDVISGVMLSTVTGADATAGTHPITASGGTAVNYEIIHVTGALTVDQAAPLTVTADNKAKFYGAAELVLTYTPSGTLFYDDEYDVITGVNLSTATGAAATAGTHVIAVSGGTADNYGSSG